MYLTDTVELENTGNIQPAEEMPVASIITEFFSINIIRDISGKKE
jgi:hypothetical protein